MEVADPRDVPLVVLDNGNDMHLLNYRTNLPIDASKAHNGLLPEILETKNETAIRSTPQDPLVRHMQTE